MRDPSMGLYRSKEEVEEEKKADPILTFRDRLLREGLLDEAGWAALAAEVETRVGEAVAFAEASPEPPAEWLVEDVYA
jgi:pyruvate dehydrogenase E1 component alpha subunit